MSFKIESLSAFTQVDEEGTEGVIAFLSGDNTWMPLIMADEGRLVSMRPFAERTAQMTGRPVRLLRFSTMEVVEVIAPFDPAQERGG